MRKCLLIKTEDKRNFLLWKRDLKKILEFAKTFQVNIFEVELKEKCDILDAKKLVSEFCNPNYKNDVHVNIIDKIYPKPKKDRKEILGDAKKIQKFVRDQLLRGNPVSLKILKEKYKNCNVTDACLCNHLSNVRKSLVSEGKNVEKVGAGKYIVA